MYIVYIHVLHTYNYVHVHYNSLATCIYRNVFYASHNSHLHFSDSFDVSLYLETTNIFFTVLNK